MAIYVGTSMVAWTALLAVGDKPIVAVKLGQYEVWPTEDAPVNAPPNPIDDFSASSNTIDTIKMTFGPAGGFPDPIYNLFENGFEVVTDIATGYVLDRTGPYTADYHVEAVNSQGSADSNIDSGTAHEYVPPPPGEAPGYISNFSATDDEIGQITFTFSTTSGNPTPTYYIFEDGTDKGRIYSSGETWEYPGGHTANFQVQAYNSTGDTLSNTDSGISATISGLVIVDFDGYSADPGGEGTVSIDNGIGAFTVPAGVTSVRYTVQGAGGSGAYRSCPDSSSDEAGGGGRAGGFLNFIAIQVAPGEVIPFTIGKGGIGVWNSNSAVNGNQGGTSEFQNIVGGGAGGTWSDDNNCSYDLGAVFSGIFEYANTNFFSYGGEASGAGGAGGQPGYADLHNESGMGVVSGHGEAGSGGGARVVADNTDVSAEGISGNGGDGQVVITWG